MKRKRFFLISSLSLFFLLGLSLFVSVKDFPGHERLRIHLRNALTRAELLEEAVNHSSAQPDTVLYVLGGRQGYLKKSFKIAADLYHRGFCTKIFFLSTPGITEYDPRLGRNLTNNEWALRELMDLRVTREDIVPLSFVKGFFGTLTEAKGLAGVVAQQGYRRLLLVTSGNHTRRVWETFSSIMEGQYVTFRIYGTEDDIGLPSLLQEYFKLILYENVLLPAFRLRLYGGGQVLFLVIYARLLVGSYLKSTFLKIIYTTVARNGIFLANVFLVPFSLPSP